MGAEHFEFDFTEEQVIELLRGNEEAEDWYDAMCEILPLWEINTIPRVAGFIAQCGHCLTFAAHHTATVSWLRQNLPKALHVRGQAMYATLAYGLGGTLGTLAGKVAWSEVSPSSAFYLAALSGLLAFMVGQLLYRSSQQKAVQAVGF